MTFAFSISNFEWRFVDVLIGVLLPSYRHGRAYFARLFHALTHTIAPLFYTEIIRETKLCVLNWLNKIHFIIKLISICTRMLATTVDNS